MEEALRNIIKQNEVENDGQTIHLYYNKILGLYQAFGWSAYYVDMVTNPVLSYSDTMKMPMAMLAKRHVLYLRQSMTMVEHVVHSYYRFQLRLRIGDTGYKRWEEKILKNP